MTETKNRDDIISTGIEKLDRLLEGGIPKGFTVLLMGMPVEQHFQSDSISTDSTSKGKINPK